ncbi:MAG: hypothetical protein JSR58_02670 [Verrucomicrobia bacterium]|nr:hypothetical protein [Verrucomicrobiota bacterium]
MLFAANFVKDVVKDHAVTVALFAAGCALAEPVCQVVKNTWESRMLGLGYERNTNENHAHETCYYDYINQQNYSDLEWANFITKAGVAFNSMRPFANYGLSGVVVPFLAAAVVLKLYK